MDHLELLKLKIANHEKRLLALEKKKAPPVTEPVKTKDKKGFLRKKKS